MENRSYLGSITKYRELGEGTASIVYHCTYFDADFAYKEYKTFDEYVRFIKPRLERLSEFYNDNRFVFPYKFIYKNRDDELFQGYVMNYLYNYEKLSRLNDLEYEEKINILKKARTLLDEFHNTYKHIHTDITPWNFLYNKEMDKVTLIDFDTAVDLKHKDDINEHFNILAETYCKYNGIDKDLDIFMFNLVTYALLNNENDFYGIIKRIIENDYGIIESENARKILSTYDDITNPKTLKKDYVIDCL